MINPNIQVVMLGITDETSLLGYPKSGASWEGFAIEQVLQAFRPAQPFFRLSLAVNAHQQCNLAL